MHQHLNTDANKCELYSKNVSTLMTYSKYSNLFHIIVYETWTKLKGAPIQLDCTTTVKILLLSDFFG